MKGIGRERRLSRFRCPVCDRLVAGYNPKDGDGSARRLRPHNRYTQAANHHSFPCDGSRLEVDVAAIVEDY